MTGTWVRGRSSGGRSGGLGSTERTQYIRTVQNKGGIISDVRH